MQPVKRQLILINVHFTLMSYNQLCVYLILFPFQLRKIRDIPVFALNFRSEDRVSWRIAEKPECKT